MKTAFLSKAKKFVAAAVLAGTAAAAAPALATPAFEDEDDDRRDTAVRYAIEKNRTGENVNPGQEIRLSKGLSDWARLETFLNMPEDGNNRPDHILQRGLAFDTLAARVRVPARPLGEAELNLGKFYSGGGFVHENAAPGFEPLLTLDEASRRVSLHDQTGADFRYDLPLVIPGVTLRTAASVFYSVPMLNNVVGSTGTHPQEFSPGWTSQGVSGGLSDSARPSYAGGGDLIVREPGIAVTAGASGARLSQGASNTSDQTMLDLHGLVKIGVTPHLDLLGVAQSVRIDGYKGDAGVSARVNTAVAVAQAAFKAPYGDAGFVVHGAVGGSSNTAEAGSACTAVEAGVALRAAWFKAFASLGGSYAPDGPAKRFGAEGRVGLQFSVR